MPMIGVNRVVQKVVVNQNGLYGTEKWKSVEPLNLGCGGSNRHDRVCE